MEPIHQMTVEELLDYIVENYDDIAKNKDYRTLLKNRITKLQGYAKRALDLLDSMEEN